MAKLAIIVAADLKGGIGKDGTLPWKISEDMAFFRMTTYGHTVIMGRKTHESIGKALPGRRNIVISRDKAYVSPCSTNVVVVHSLEDAIVLSQHDQNVFIIGGGEIYKQALPLVDTLVVTEVLGEFECDTIFPKIEPDEWTKGPVKLGSMPIPVPYRFFEMTRKVPVQQVEELEVAG